MKSAAALLAVLLLGSAQESDETYHWKEPTPEEMERRFPHRAKLHPTRLETLAAQTAACGSPGGNYYLDEARAIRETGRARRDGDDLWLGKMRFRENSFIPDGRFGPREEPEYFAYAGAYRKPKVDLVHVWYYEGNGWRLVHRETGTVVEFAEPPMPSPSGRYFAAASQAEAYNPHGVQIAELTPHGLKMVAQFDWALAKNPCDLRWISDRRLTVREQPDLTYPPDARHRTAAFGLVKGKWQRLTAPRHPSDWDGRPIGPQASPARS